MTMRIAAAKQLVQPRISGHVLWQLDKLAGGRQLSALVLDRLRIGASRRLRPQGVREPRQSDRPSQGEHQLRDSCSVCDAALPLN